MVRVQKEAVAGGSSSCGQDGGNNVRGRCRSWSHVAAWSQCCALAAPLQKYEPSPLLVAYRLPRPKSLRMRLLLPTRPCKCWRLPLIVAPASIADGRGLTRVVLGRRSVAPCGLRCCRRIRSAVLCGLRRGQEGKGSDGSRGGTSCKGERGPKSEVRGGNCGDAPGKGKVKVSPAIYDYPLLQSHCPCPFPLASPNQPALALSVMTFVPATPASSSQDELCADSL